MNHGSMLMGKTAQGDIAATNVPTDFGHHDRVTADEVRAFNDDPFVALRLVGYMVREEILRVECEAALHLLAAEESSTDDEWDA